MSSEPFARLRRFLRELKRRNVYKVAVAYLAVAFVGLQAARLLVPATTLPGWADELLIYIAVFGFPIALVVAWAFELTPEGVRRTADAERASESEAMPPEERRAQSHLAMRALVGLGLVGAAVAGGWYLMGGGGGENPEINDRSVAVLPFEALGNDEPGTFTEGMHSDLQTKLSNITGLTVTSSRSVERYRGSDESTAAVARELGVGWIVSGDVQRMGDQIQVNVRLVDPDTDTQAWTDSYRRDLTAENLFAIQTDITRQIARSLEVQLTAEETERMERRPTERLDAYKLYVEGRSQLDTRTDKGKRRAVDYFRRAIQRDSSYALAWAGLADAIGLLFEGSAFADSLPDHEATARRALELGPDLAEAHASMGLVHMQDRNGPAALRALKRAVELKPSYAQAHHWLGWTYRVLGRLDLAREHASLAVRLNPRHSAARVVLIRILLFQNEIDRARKHLRQLSEDYPGYPGIKRWVLYYAQQWNELARWSRKQLSEADDSAVDWHFSLARVAVSRGDAAAAREHLGAIRGAEEPDSRTFLFQGLTHAALGQTDSAFEAWGRIEDWQAYMVYRLRYGCGDILNPLRDDPRYKELIREANRTWGLNPDGSLPDSVDVSFKSESDE